MVSMSSAVGCHRCSRRNLKHKMWVYRVQWGRERERCGHTLSEGDTHVCTNAHTYDLTCSCSYSTSHTVTPLKKEILTTAVTRLIAVCKV